MTDQPPGSGSSSPHPEDGGDLRPDRPDPFSRESWGGGGHSLDPSEGTPAAPPAAGTPGERDGSPSNARRQPGAQDRGRGEGYPYGPVSQGPQSGDEPYGQARYPDPTAQPDPPSPYGQPAQPPYGPPPGAPYAEPAPPYPQPAGGYDPPEQPYGQPAPGGYQVNPYQGTYGGYSAYGVPPVQHPQAVAALVTGLLGVLLCPLVGIAGVVLGNKARREIDADPVRYTGRGLATAGFVLGIVGTVFTALGIVLLVLLGVAGQ